MFRFAMIGLVLCSSTLVITGCGSPRSERPKPKANLMDTWEEGQKFFAGEENYAVFGNLSSGDIKAAVAGLKDPAFKAKVDGFEALALPEGFEEKADDKAAVVDSLKSMIKIANGSGDRPTIESIYKQMEASKAKMIASE